MTTAFTVPRTRRPAAFFILVSATITAAWSIVRAILDIRNGEWLFALTTTPILILLGYFMWKIWSDLKATRVGAEQRHDLLAALAGIPNGAILGCRNEHTIIAVKYHRYLSSHWGAATVYRIDETQMREGDLSDPAPALAIGHLFFIGDRDGRVGHTMVPFQVSRDDHGYVSLHPLEQKTSFRAQFKTIRMMDRTGAGTATPDELADLARLIRAADPITKQE